MRIMQISQNTSAGYGAMLPRLPFRNNIAVYGAEENGEPAGVIAAEIYSEGASIFYIYVLPQFRNSGIGGRLIDAVTAHVAGSVVEISYPSDESWSAELGTALMRRGFLLNVQKIPRYEISRKAIGENPVLIPKTNKSKKTANTPHIIPFSRLKASQLNEFTTRCEKKGAYAAARADFVAIDGALSMALVIDNHIEGIVLMRDLKNGSAELELFYISGGYGNYGLSLLGHTAEALLEHSPEIENLSFACAAQNAAALAAKLFPQTEYSIERVVNGMLWANRRKGGR